MVCLPPQARIRRCDQRLKQKPSRAGRTHGSRIGHHGTEQRPLGAIGHLRLRELRQRRLDRRRGLLVARSDNIIVQAACSQVLSVVRVAVRAVLPSADVCMRQDELRYFAQLPSAV